ncbi:ABC transporter [Metamycoplasma cloacale]|uniref:Uncharacterized protein n=1 Tax=Metamycoplasma cloacale TaxID=92401 RepID=A0A2Z4LLY2_9BACT|nr:ABC transporter permease [Metamycoplasma cloacale]AWX42801.1 hypothetical protein DK849_01850 [Metamycoplasma cloacale]VEU79380.1 ABC transporter [Metamycoplasma cloacale]
MKQVIQLFKRNCLCFLKDPKRIFFTIMAPVIIFACFLLFAKNIYKEQMNQTLNAQEVINNLYLYSPDTKELIKKEYADWFLLIGMMTVIPFTNALSITSVMVSDAEKKVLNDLFITPVRSSSIRFSYWFFNLILNIIISTFIYTIILTYMTINKTLTFDSIKTLKVWGIVLFSCVFNSAMVVFFISFVKNTGVFAALNSVLSMISGFLTGAFIPLTSMPKEVAELASLIPTTQISNLLRTVLLDGKDIFANSISAAHSYLLWIDKDKIEMWHITLYILSFTALFIFLNFAIKYNKQKK